MQGVCKASMLCAVSTNIYTPNMSKQYAKHIIFCKQICSTYVHCDQFGLSLPWSKFTSSTCSNNNNNNNNNNKNKLRALQCVPPLCFLSTFFQRFQGCCCMLTWPIVMRDWNFGYRKRFNFRSVDHLIPGKLQSDQETVEHLKQTCISYM